MNYYLLTFKTSLADEFDIPAQECFSQTEYDVWLRTRIIKKDPNYYFLLAAWQDQYIRYKQFEDECTKRGILLKPYDNLTEEDKLWRDKNFVHYTNQSMKPVKGTSLIRAEIGNNSEDCHFGNFEFAEELVDAGIVQVFEVDNTFYETFHKAMLSNMSLSNIFKVHTLTDGD